MFHRRFYMHHLNQGSMNDVHNKNKVDKSTEVDPYKMFLMPSQITNNHGAKAGGAFLFFSHPSSTHMRKSCSGKRGFSTTWLSWAPRKKHWVKIPKRNAMGVVYLNGWKTSDEYERIENSRFSELLNELKSKSS